MPGKKYFEYIKVGYQFKYRNVHYMKIHPFVKYNNWGLRHLSAGSPYWYADVREKVVNCVSLHSGKVFYFSDKALVTTGDYFDGKRSKRV